MTADLIQDQFKSLQDYICQYLEKVDGSAKFEEDLWQREAGGGGRTRIIRKGNVIEKGGVNFSAVEGPVTDLMKKQLQMEGDTFFASGVSIVLHPNSPKVPIIHMNVRYFELNTGEYWFGGGIDLTPHYIVPANARKFHLHLKSICDAFSHDAYADYKKWADDYFYIPHREETRGIGGIFFDHLKASEGIAKEQILDFCLALGKAFPSIYEEQVNLGKHLLFSEQEKQWQLLRRGRYVEFNLVNDRGTKFGLVSGGRTESILMSLPASANWEYDFKPSANSPEAFTLAHLKKGINWLSEELQ